MPTFVRPRGRGRPKQDPIDLLRTRVWINALKDRTGLANGHALLAFFEPELIDADGIVRNKKWVHYDKGRREPKRFKGEPSAVDIAEAGCPGSSTYFHSAMWRVMKREKLTPKEIDRYLVDLGASVSAILKPKARDAVGSSFDFKEMDADDFAELVHLGTFDALEAVILLAAKGDAIASHELKNSAQSAYLKMALALSKLPEFDGVADEVFTAIDASCRHWVYPKTHSRLEVVIFTKEYVRLQQEGHPLASVPKDDQTET